MEHTGYIRIERKKIPFYLKDKKVHLIPDNPFASLMPGNINFFNYKITLIIA